MVHVLCFGNLWHGDDGFAIHVCRHLVAKVRDEAIRVFEVGLRGLDALPLFDNCDQVILVDALHEPATPAGSLRILAATEIASQRDADSHAAGVAYLLQALAATHAQPPSICLIGAVITTIKPFTDRLSPPLAAAVPQVAAAVLRQAATADVEFA